MDAILQHTEDNGFLSTDGCKYNISTGDSGTEYLALISDTKSI